jgi:hypothetical protein
LASVGFGKFCAEDEPPLPAPESAGFGRGFVDFVVAKKKAKRVEKPKYIAKASPRSAKQKPISLSYPKPDEMKGKVRVEPPKIPPHVEPPGMPSTHGMKNAGKKKALPYAATAVGGALLLSGALAVFFYMVISLDAVFSLMLALPFFIGLSILFYNFLELSERTGAQ